MKVSPVLSISPVENITATLDSRLEAHPRRRGLFLKYVLSLVGLVTLVLLVSGLLDVWFAYREVRQAAFQVQQEKSEAAAQRITQFVTDIERQIGWTTQPQWAAGTVEQRRFDYIRLLRQVPAITEIAQLDADGREQLKVSRLAMDAVGSNTDWSQDPRFIEAKAARLWFSPVYFRKESEPYISFAMAQSGRNAGVTVAEVNLKLIWDVITAIKVGKTGYSYVVDGRGRLIAHPDISLVLRKTDFSRLPQVAAARDGAPVLQSDGATLVANFAGQRVISAHAPIAQLGWFVFVELPLAEAVQPLLGSALRTGVLLLVGLLLASGAGLLLARRMVLPIRVLESGAARLGAGQLDHRITISTGDELEALAASFNRMAEQLEESYAGLERKVDERTRELAAALEVQTATGEVLKVISRSTFDLEPVLCTVLDTAARLCQADIAAVYRFENEVMRFSVGRAGDPSDYDKIDRATAFAPGPGSLVGRVASELHTIHILDALADPHYEHRKAASMGEMRTMLGVPLLREGTLIGALTLARSRVEAFTEKQISLVTTFADQAVIAIENTRLLSELQARTADLARSVEELTTLREVGQAVSSTLDLATVLATIVEHAVGLSGAAAGAIYRYREADRQFQLGTSYRFGDDLAAAIHGVRIREDETTAMGRAVNERVPVQIADLGTAPNFPLRDLTYAAGFRSVLMVPLVGPDRVFGVLAIQRMELGEFPGDVVRLMQTFAAQSALAIQNARLFREVEEQGRALAIASQHKSQFLANMSHELRTPLNAVLGFAELLVDGIYGELPERARGALERVQSNGRHLLGLINDVLDLSKIEAGQLTLAFDDYALGGIVRSVQSATEPLARAKGLSLTVDIAAGMPRGRGDERRLTQVLLNLIGNAIKFTDAGGITISAQGAEGHFSVAVCDTGPSIADSDQQRIFEEFQQVDSTNTRRKGGTGLGLAISRRIVEMHGGTLTVESVLGQGSTFRMSVPMHAAQTMEAAE
jgi:signal transduction histidine kinase